MITEMITAVTFSAAWYFLRESGMIKGFIFEIEPMMIGLLAGGIIHFYGILRKKISDPFEK